MLPDLSAAFGGRKAEQENTCWEMLRLRYILRIRPIPNGRLCLWDTEIAGATPVFSSTTYSIPAGTGFKQVVFTTPFAWDGTSNIAVFVDWYRPGTPTADISWARSTTTSTNATRVGGTLTSVNPLLVNNNRPLLQLQIEPPLPVKLVSFSATRKNEDIHLSWFTQTEQNSHRFEIEVSDDGSAFTYCGNIVAAGNSVALKTYAFVHHYPLLSVTNKNHLFYRLKMIDNDGHFSYSNIVKISLQQASYPTSVLVYPNPVKDVFILSVSGNGMNNFTYTLLGTDGRIIQKRTGTILGSGILTIDALQQRPAGTYFLQVQTGSECNQIKIIKQ